MVFKVVFFFLFFTCSFAEKGFHTPWGKDANLRVVSPKKEKKSSLAAKTAGGIIHFYQNYLSPTTGARSNFRPTSSKYMELAIQRYGFLKGFVMGCDRLLRENNEKWIYPTLAEEQGGYKYDPAFFHKRLAKIERFTPPSPELSNTLSK